jgi:hypothetical protein
MLLDELATYLQAEGIGTLGTSLFKGSIPLSDAQDALVALIETPGLPPVRSHDMPPARYEQPVLQVATRGQPYGYAAARQKAQDAWDVLDGVANATLSGTLYLWIEALQSPFWLRTDDLERPLVVFNIRCARAL